MQVGRAYLTYIVTRVTISGMFKTKGRLALARWLEQSGTTQTALGEKIGTSQAPVSMWVLGKSRPDWTQRLGLFVVTGIDPNDWATPAETALLRRLGARVRFVVEAAA